MERTIFLSAAVWVAILLAMNAAVGGEQQFFRALGPRGSVIVELKSDGSLVWANPTADGATFTIQSSTDLSSDAGWADFTSIPATSVVQALQVFVRSAPDGMVFIPGGGRRMGDTSNDGPDLERPVHTVGITAYYTSATHAPANIYRTGNIDIGNDCVNWNAGYRLPTEAEWETAARGGMPSRYPWGDLINHDDANFCNIGHEDYASGTTGFHPLYFYDEPYGTFTSPVGSFAMNRYGLYDVVGNVWEWCWDWWLREYTSSPVTDPRGPDTGSYRVKRGGGWGSEAKGSRVALRTAELPTYTSSHQGFRCVLLPTVTPSGSPL